MRLRRAGLRALHPAESLLLEEGAHPPGLLLLLAGHLDLFLERRGRRIVVELVEPGELVPDLDPLYGRPSTVSAVAIEPVDVLYVPALAFAAFLESRPALAFAALRTQGDALRDAYRRSARNATADTTTRLAASLLELATRFGRSTDAGLVLDLPVTQDVLAGWIGASRTATVTAFMRLRRLGLLQTSRRRVTLSDPEGLRRIAGYGGEADEKCGERSL